VKRVIHLMTWGDDANPDALPLNMIDACAVVGVKAYRMRRYLDRPSVIAHLRAEHRKFREVVCSGNAAALRRVRDHSPNGLAVVASCRALDAQSEDSARADAPSPGVTIRIINQQSQPAPIDITPTPPRIIDAGDGG
jgi:hypothetical protein